MNRSFTARLRSLEGKRPARPLHILWSDKSDPSEWDRKQAELIAWGKADAGDNFMRIGWRRPRVSNCRSVQEGRTRPSITALIDSLRLGDTSTLARGLVLINNQEIKSAGLQGGAMVSR
jgi:hypothetical protein